MSARPLIAIPNTRGSIQRTAQLPTYQHPNAADFCLADEAQYIEDILSTTRLENICCPRGRKPYPQRPWIAMPSEGRRFRPIQSIAIPVDGGGAVILNTETVVMEMPVSIGYDGIITDVVCELAAPGNQATGFTEGSGDVIWRLRITSPNSNARFARDYGNIQTTLGSLVYPSPVPRGGIRIFSGNIVTFTVTFANNAQSTINTADRVICSVSGWIYPK